MEGRYQPTTDILAPGELARRLIRFDTTSLGGSERELIAWLAPLLEAAGLDVQLLARDPERPNIVFPSSTTW
ncbi:MAG: Peptidase [Solirubrobacterales bacterium]|nr:Peptidase [Solirubrobacterales bacterium]